LRQIGDGIVGEMLRLDFAALRHVENTLGDDFLGDAPVTRLGKCAAGFFDLPPRFLVGRDQFLDQFGIERGLCEKGNYRHRNSLGRAGVVEH
jgi:hypothetical protein